MMRRPARPRSHHRIGWFFISPWLVGFTLFSAFPFFYSLYLSFAEARFTITGIVTRPVGFANYLRALLREGQLDFLPALVSFVAEAAVSTPLLLVYSLVLALLLNQETRLRGLLRAIYFIPVIILSGPVLAQLEAGGLTRLPGVESFILVRMIASLSPAIAKVILFLFDNLIRIFWFAGVQIVILLNGLQKVDRSLYEAASIAGASSWQSFWKITLPIVRPLLLLVAIYTIVQLGAFSENAVSKVIRANLFAIVAGAGYGYSAALAWIYFTVMAVLMGVFFLVLRERKGRDAPARVIISASWRNRYRPPRAVMRRPAGGAGSS